ncbi:MAG TPA: AAA family ATPase [Acidimicrobiia bacterium]|nr:AAA family ATPase [Acidimicrobiia bacterium]
MIHTGCLVEREKQLQALEDAVAGSSRSGQVVVLSGEAGFGKTSLLGELINHLDHRHRVMLASCEPLGIPAPFAPLFDLMGDLPDDVMAEIRSGSSRPAVYSQMLEWLRQERVVLILEDMHRADEATLGLTRYLGRRMSQTMSCLILTYRSEEVDLAHPLRLVIADIGPAAIRVELPALTLTGVELMAEGRDVDAVSVYEATLGNPFFVDELVRSPTESLPTTIGDAVLARVSRLPEDAHELLYTVALSSDGVPLDLLTDDPRRSALADLAVQRRLLEVSGGQVTCRHDLIREALLRMVPPVVGRDLHARLLSFHEANTDDPVDPAKLAYHSIGAGESEKAARYSLLAGRDATRGGAHRQAAFHLANALRFEDVMAPEVLQVALLEGAQEHCLINEFAIASELAERRVRASEGPRGQARARAWYAYFKSRENDLEASRREASFATDALGVDGPCEELALALAVLAWVELVEGNSKGAVDVGDQAIDLARAVGSLEVEVHAATTAGMARAFLRDPAARAQVEQAAELGVSRGLGEFAARALNDLALIDLDAGELDAARAAFDRMIEYCSAHELDAWYIAGVTSRAWVNVAAGRWDDADTDLEVVLGQRTCLQTEVETLITAATLRARRGDPGSEELIGQALAHVDGTRDYWGLVLGCSLALEGAWLGVVPLDDALSRYEALLGSPALTLDDVGRAILAYWARRLGLDPPPGSILGAPGLEWRGAIEEAAHSWQRKGFVVHAAVTRAMLPDADLDAAFAYLAGMGAEGVIRGLRRELQRREVKRIPRGERRTTRDNPAGLTTRQAEVLDLMVSGLSNAAIAERLFISEKTASHHVSAVLAKLNVSSRLQAAAMATARGWSQPISGAQSR